MQEYIWPYANEMDREERLEADVLVLGGGMAGCYAAIAAARAGKKVVLLEKGATVRSGAAGSGVDHWESACTNPCSKVTAEEIARAYIDEQDGYSNGIPMGGFAQIFSDLGCVSAYNMDGGDSAVMLFNGSRCNRPSHGGRDLGDMLYITELPSDTPKGGEG